MELRGVGDFQSSGITYRSLGDVGKIKNIQPGDRVKFIGQRKLFGLGFIGGMKGSLRKGEKSYGGGLLWNLTFPDGWGAEILFGGYFSKVGIDHGIKVLTMKDSTGEERRNIPVISEEGKSGVAENGEAYNTLVVAPTIIKKNFFYPRAVSPFLGVGFGFFRGEYEAKKTVVNSTFEQQYFGFTTFHIRGNVYSGSVTKETVFPIFAGGINLFPGRFLQFRADAKYLLTPDLSTGFSTLETKGFVHSVGFSTNW